MSENQFFLNSLLNTAQQERTGVESVLNYPMRPTLRRCLESQRREYDAIEREAVSIAASRGWDLQNLEPSVKLMHRANTRLKLFHGHTDSKIAGLMIQTSTRSLVDCIRQQRQFDTKDQSLEILCQKLQDCENANIRQMQMFL